MGTVSQKSVNSLRRTRTWRTERVRSQVIALAYMPASGMWYATRRCLLVSTYLQTGLRRMRFLRFSSVLACLASCLSTSLACAVLEPAYRAQPTCRTLSASHFACMMMMKLSLVMFGVGYRYVNGRASRNDEQAVVVSSRCCVRVSRMRVRAC